MRIKVHVQTGLLGSRQETEFDVDDAALEGLTEAEKEQIIEEDAREAMFNLIEWGWEPA